MNILKKLYFYIFTCVIYFLIFGVPLLLFYVGYNYKQSNGLSDALIWWGVSQIGTLSASFIDEVNTILNKLADSHIVILVSRFVVIPRKPKIIIRFERISIISKILNFLRIISPAYAPNVCIFCKKDIPDGVDRLPAGIGNRVIHLSCEAAYIANKLKK
jgi:hypothetical protein